MAENEPDNGSDVLSQRQAWLEPVKPAVKARSALPEEILARVREELTCCLCLDLAARPATLLCGHSACRGCLTELFNMGRPDAECRCPACRAPLPAGTQPLQLNPTLKCLAELLLPEECKERGRVPSPPPLPSRPHLRQRVLLYSGLGRRSVSMHTASDLTAAGMRAAHAALRAMLGVGEDRWPELEEVEAHEPVPPAQPGPWASPAHGPAQQTTSPAQHSTPAAPPAQQQTPSSARRQRVPRAGSQQAQRSAAATSPTPVRWRSARALEARPSPSWRSTQRSASPAQSASQEPAAAAFGSPAELDHPAAQPASAQPAEAAASHEPAMGQAAPAQQDPAPAGSETAEQSPDPSAAAGSASVSTLPPAPAPTATAAGSAGHQEDSPAGVTAATPSAAGTAAGQAARGRQGQQHARNAGRGAPAGAGAAGRSRSSTSGRRSLSAPGLAGDRAALPRWQR